MREVTHRYEDPLDRVWVEVARRVGLRVRRTPHAFAATDGAGELAIGEPSTLDADDCLAQMIFHELCHSLVEGPESFEREDWGLDNETDRDLPRERACLRAQAYLGSRYGLRRCLAPTTDHRAFYDALGPDPLRGDAADVTLARLAVTRAERDPWHPHLEAGLEATRAIVEAAAPFAPPASLFALLEPARRPHPAGGWVHPAEVGGCGACAWAFEGGSGRPRLRCAARSRVRVERAWPGCERFAARVACEDCGACCREAYGAVELSARDPFVKAHPTLVTLEDGRRSLRRVDGRCPALEGGDGRDYRCRHYTTRPRSCREFTRGGANCFEARRRVGLSP